MRIVHIPRDPMDAFIEPGVLVYCPCGFWAITSRDAGPELGMDFGACVDAWRGHLDG